MSARAVTIALLGLVAVSMAMSVRMHPMMARSLKHLRRPAALVAARDEDICQKITCVGDQESCTDWDDLFNESSPELFICSSQQNCVGQTEFTSNGTCSDPFPIGTRCYYDEDCSTKTYLSQGDAYCDEKTRVCTLKKQDGQACVAVEECEPPLMCSTKTNTCVDVRVGEAGASCEDEDDDACLPVLECVAGVCTPYLELGQACDDFVEGKYCKLGLACVDNVCSPLQSGKVGQACSITLDCLAGLVCDQNAVCSKPSAAKSHESDCGDDCDTQSICACDHDDGKTWCNPQETASDDLVYLYWAYTRCMHDNGGDEYECAEELEKYIWADPDVEVDIQDYCLGI